MAQLSKEQQEFVQLVTSHQGQLRGLCRLLLPGSDADAEDVLQDVNRVILEKSGDFQRGTNFKTWAYAIVRFQVMALRSSQKRDRLFFSSDLVESLTNEMENDGLFEQRQKWLVDCLQELKKNERELIEVRYGSGVTLAKYATKLGRTVGGLKRSLVRIRERLKSCIRHKSLSEGVL